MMMHTTIWRKIDGCTFTRGLFVLAVATPLGCEWGVVYPPTDLSILSSSGGAGGFVDRAIETPELLTHYTCSYLLPMILP